MLSEQTFIECAISATNSGRNTSLDLTSSSLRLEDYVAGLFAEITMKQKTRCALLAGSMMSVIAAAPAMAADELSAPAFTQAPIVLAQAIDAQPKTKAPPPKGAPPPAAVPRAAPPPPPVQPKAVQTPPVQPKAVQAPPPAPTAQPPVPAQPRQFGVPKGVQQPPVQTQQTPPTQPGLPKTMQPVQTQPVPPKGPQPTLTQPALKGPQPVQRQPAVGVGTPPSVAPGTPGFARPGPGVVQPPPPVAGVTPMRGNVDQLRSHRIERKENDGRVVIQEPGGRVIVRDQGRVFIRHDETQRFRHFGGNHRFEERGRERFDYVGRPGGYQIITVTDHNGRMLRRMRRGPDGREVVLINNAVVGAAVATGFILALAAPQILIPRERYIVDVAAPPPALLYETFNAAPVVPLERAYALDEIRYNVALRDRVRRVDLTAITFDSGSWELGPEQFPRLEAVANGIRQVLSANPDAVFMIEGHTDAVGADVDNLSLSDRRAESVAVVLTEQFQIPPENLVTQGYGEQYLKVPVEGPNRENRRVAVRNISPLLAGK
jgi:outer membrane protein OmpA-like peptidoglycan-associated protein